jgi:probable F420-dependent oxidoreductase
VADRLEIGIGLPQTRAGAAADAAELAAFARAVEDAGLDAAWTMESHLGPAQALEPVPVLAVAAAHTSRIRLGNAVFVLALHQPVRLASILASLDHLSRGRLIVGVGVGSPGVPYAAFGSAARGRAARLEESLEVMRRLWSDPAPVSHPGRFVTLDGARIAPPPVQRPLPVWFGGTAEPALRRAVALGDGWIGAGTSSAGTFAACAARVRELLDEAGRDAAAFPIAKRAYVAVDQPEARVAEFYRTVYGAAPPPDDVVFRGDAGAVGERLAGLAAAGARHLVIHPIGEERPQLDALVERAVPELRRAHGG